MKKVSSVICIVLLSCLLCSCTNERIAQEAHVLNHHEIMSLETKTERYFAVDRVYVDIGKYMEEMVQYERAYACVEAKCLEVKYYLTWDEKDQCIRMGFSEYSIQLTKIGKSNLFSHRKKELLTVRGVEYLNFSSVFDDDIHKVQYLLDRNTFLESHGGTVDPDTGWVTLPSGDYELIPTSDMQLTLCLVWDDILPMAKGETYTLILREGQEGSWHACHAYPVSLDSEIFKNNFYNMNLSGIENMYLVAYFAENPD